MKRFRVNVRTEAGTLEERVISARTPEEAGELARLQGMLPEDIQEVVDSDQTSWLGGGGAVPLTELYHFTRLFATLTRAGVPILEAMMLLHDQTTHPTLKGILARIAEDIKAGTSIAAAFREHAACFDATYLHLLAVGEESGELSRVLARLTAMLDKRIKLRRLVRKAMTYPLLVMSLSAVVTWAILAYIVPRFKDIYRRFGSELPWPTRLTIATSDILATHAVASLGVVIVGLAVWWVIGRTSTGRRVYDRIALGLPLIGPMYHTFEIAGFAKSFSILIHSGITVVSALDILVPAVQRIPIREALKDAAEGVRSGRPMGESFAAQAPWLPDILNKMVTVGERTGNLTEMLDHVAEFYEEEFYNKVETLASLIEPIMIVFLGVVIGGLVISLYLPIFGMARLIARR